MWISGSVFFIAQGSGPLEQTINSAGGIQSVWDFVVKGGPTMAVIGLCSLVALTVIVERLIVLRRRGVIPRDFVINLNAIASDRTRAMELCKSNNSPAANVLMAALRRRGESIESVEKAAEEAGRREHTRLRQRMRLLGALPQISTMLGLLGTIFGMIKTFQAVAASGQALGKTELLAKGIFEAWTCTAAGLLVAIPVLIAFHYLMGRIDQLVVELEQLAVDFVEDERAARSAARQPAEPRVQSDSGAMLAIAAGAQ
ncbi:MAG: MotA/TolQ/ExbB proton channel family protein [Phycisphaerales bacterium]|nr:MotA/TolQ/ExbB proton channel family protein [Phycisphaerales bacterium]